MALAWCMSIVLVYEKPFQTVSGVCVPRMSPGSSHTENEIDQLSQMKARFLLFERCV